MHKETLLAKYHTFNDLFKYNQPNIQYNQCPLWKISKMFESLKNRYLFGLKLILRLLLPFTKDTSCYSDAHWYIVKLLRLWVAILHPEGRDLGIVVFIKTCKIATCFVLFHYQTRDGVVVLWYYMSNKHYYAASTSVLYYYI